MSSKIQYILLKLLILKLVASGSVQRFDGGKKNDYGEIISES